MLNSLLRRVPTWVVYIAGSLPALWMAYQTLSGTIGIDPVRAIEWGLGLWALRLLIATLCVTPLRWIGLNLMRFRRQLGLVAFAYVVLHLAAWLTIDMGLRWGQILPDLVKRWYIVVGMAALTLLLPLAATSNNASIRTLGPKAWNRLHMLAYPATILATVHCMMVGKVYTAEVLIYAGILSALLAWRAARFLLRGRALT